jgi:glycosyltransferase involved in cell wall biosynthesis
MFRMLRLAWLSPLPPTRSGIATYSAELLPLLVGHYAIEAFTGPSDEPAAPQPCPVYPAHDFAWRHFKAPYDLVVYQLGNATCHEFQWPYLVRYPGLVVLHDAQLHHSRAKSLLRRGRLQPYREELAFNHPGTPEDLSDFIRFDLAGCQYYFWPMLRLAAQSARRLAVHNRRLAATLADGHGIDVTRIRMGVTDPLGVVPPSLPPALRHPGASEAPPVRAQHGVAPEAVLFAAFGLVTPEKRISQILRAMAALVGQGVPIHLLLVGGAVTHYDALAEAASLGLEGRVSLTGYVPDEALHRYVAAADVVLSLRWPTGRETSGTWIQAIAAGRPTIITELTHQDDIAWLDPRSWTIEASAWHAPEDPDRLAPVAVAIDILDEEHSLRLAMKRLATDAPLRERLGRQARRHWERTHTLSHMADDYHAAIAAALAQPAAAPRDLPSHVLEDGTERGRALLEPFGIDVDVLQGRHLDPARPRD